MSNEGRAVIVSVEGVVLNTNVEPAKNGKVYPKVILQSKGRFNEMVEFVPAMLEEVKKLKVGQRILAAVYTKVAQVEIKTQAGTTFQKTVSYLDNAYDMKVLA